MILKSFCKYRTILARAFCFNRVILFFLNLFGRRYAVSNKQASALLQGGSKMLKHYLSARQGAVCMMSAPHPVHDTVCHPAMHTDTTHESPMKICRTDVLASAVFPVVFFNRGSRKVFPCTLHHKRLQIGGELL